MRGGVITATAATVILQSTALDRITVAGVRPDLFLILVVGASLRLSPEGVTLLGFTLGLLQDALSGGPLGLNAFALSLIGFLTGGLTPDLQTDRSRTHFVLLSSAGLLSGLSSLFLLSVLGSGGVERPVAMGLRLIVPTALYTALVGTGLLALPRLRRFVTVTL